MLHADLIAFGTLTDFGELDSDNEIVLFEDDAAALKISDDSLISKDTQDLESGTHHLSLRSERLVLVLV